MEIHIKLLFLKFCYAVEIGAYLAYVGHYKRSSDKVVKTIMREELIHMVHIKRILAFYNNKPNILFNLVFLLIGHCVRLTCQVTPLVILDGVAQIMEVFNIISYDILSKSFTQFSGVLSKMSDQELQHERYFSTFPKHGRQQVLRS
jgi:hypothetical protein